jgi:hypothetical protein
MAVKRRKTRDERKGEIVKIRCTRAEKNAWSKIAEMEARGVSAWLRYVANQQVASKSR